MPIYDVDVGTVLPFAIEQNGRPVDLTGAQSVTLLVNDGRSVPLSVTDPAQGYAEYVHDGVSLTVGFKRANIRVRYDAAHIYHSDEIDFRIKGLYT